MAIWNILLIFEIFYDNLVHFVFMWYIFSSFGIMLKEKSGNPGAAQWRQTHRTVQFSFPRCRTLCPDYKHPIPGLPDGLFSNKKSQFGYVLEGLAVENVVIFCGHLVNFSAIWHFLMAIWYVLPRKIWQPFPIHRKSCDDLAEWLFRSSIQQIDAAKLQTAVTKNSVETL
jgi:hypothetical protein